MKWILALGVALAAMAVASSLDTDCVSCDFLSDENPFYECASQFAPRMLDRLLADCEAKSLEEDFEDFIINIILICEVKFDIEVDPEAECHCATCDFDYHENVFYDCYTGLHPMIQETLIRDCENHKGGPEFGEFIDNIILICHEKFDLEIVVNCACKEYTISGASLLVPTIDLINGIYEKVSGAYCDGPNAESYPVFQNTNQNGLYLFYYAPGNGWYCGPVPCQNGAFAALLTVFKFPENANQAEWIEYDGVIWNPINDLVIECSSSD